MLDKELQELDLKYRFALKTLQTQLEILIEEYKFKKDYDPVEHVVSRIKSKESAIKKLIKRGYPISVENIQKHVHDMVGIRIVVSFLQDVDAIVELIQNSSELNVKVQKDYIKNPKESGYISYHFLVEVPIHLNGKTEYIEAEIQIRTMAMDFWATLDHKIAYKFEDDMPEEVSKEIYNCALDIQNLDERMQKLNEIMKKYK